MAIATALSADTHSGNESPAELLARASALWSQAMEQLVEVRRANACSAVLASNAAARGKKDGLQATSGWKQRAVAVQPPSPRAAQQWQGRRRPQVVTATSSKARIDPVVESTEGPVNSSADSQEVEADASFDQLDLNADGVIDRDEAAAAGITSIFNTLDENKDGVINMEEWDKGREHWMKFYAKEAELWAELDDDVGGDSDCEDTEAALIADRTSDGMIDAEEAPQEWNIFEGADTSKSSDTEEAPEERNIFDGLGASKSHAVEEGEANAQAALEARPCIDRVPRKGDAVRGLAGRLGVAKTDDGLKGAWKLQPGEVAIVMDVDADHDFKLENPGGLVSAWTFRKFYEYVPVDLQAAKPTCTNGHELEKCEQEDEGCCDVCGRDICDSEDVFCCEACEFDMCKECYASKAPGEHAHDIAARDHVADTPAEVDTASLLSSCPSSCFVPNIPSPLQGEDVVSATDVTQDPAPETANAGAANSAAGGTE